MQNANDSLLAAQPHIRNSFEGISKFAMDQYIQGIASGLIVPPVSYEDSDQSPVQVSFFLWCTVYSIHSIINIKGG